MSSLLIEDMFSVKDKIFVVTGGGSGIGKSIANALSKNGAKIYIVGRRIDVLEKAAQDIGGAIIPIQGDLATKEGARAIVDRIKEKETMIDVLINCAGVSIPFRETIANHDNPESVQKMLESVEDADFDTTNGINVNGVYFLSVFLAPLLRQSENPSVIVISSVAALAIQRSLGSLTYGVSKAAAVQLSRQLAGRFHPMKIRVNCICPGIFPSEMTGETKPGSPVVLGPLAAAAVKRSTMGRPGRPEDIAAPIIMLCSIGGQYINNAILAVDGGRFLGIYDGIRMPDDSYSFDG